MFPCYERCVGIATKTDDALVILVSVKLKPLTLVTSIYNRQLQSKETNCGLIIPQRKLNMMKYKMTRQARDTSVLFLLSN